MMKSTLLLVAGAVLCTSSAVQAQRYSEGCSDGSCDLNQRSGRSYRQRLATNGRDDGYQGYGYGSNDTNCKCKDGRCCTDGQCSTTSRFRQSGCEDGRCELGNRDRDARSRNFPYALDRRSTADRSRRLDNPFRPANYNEQRYNNDRFPEADRRDSRPIPTHFQPTSYQSRRPVRRGISWNANIRDAINQAAQENRPILVQVSAPWCPHCKRMKEETYTNRNLSSLINEQFVAISVDADQQRDFIQQMGIQSLPTTLIVAPDLQVLNRLEGFQSANQLMQVLSR